MQNIFRQNIARKKRNAHTFVRSALQQQEKNQKSYRAERLTRFAL